MYENFFNHNSPMDKSCILFEFITTQIKLNKSAHRGLLPRRLWLII